MTILLVVDWLSEELLIGILFLICQINSICFIDRQVEFTRDEILSIESAMDEHTVKGLESIEDDNIGPR